MRLFSTIQRSLDTIPTDIMDEITEFHRETKAIVHYRKMQASEVSEDIRYKLAKEAMSAEFLEEIGKIELSDSVSTKKPACKSRVKLRSRTFSDTDVHSVQLHTMEQISSANNSMDSLVGADMLLEETFGSKSSLSESNNKYSENSKPIPTGKHTVPLPSYKKPLNNDPLGITSSVKWNLQDFPSLGQECVTPSAPVKLSSSLPTQSSSNVGAPTQHSRRKTKWKTLGASVGGPSVAAEGPAEKNFITEQCHNPWKTQRTQVETPTGVASLGFQDIVDEEQEKKDNLERVTNKPLRLMQVFICYPYRNFSGFIGMLVFFGFGVLLVNRFDYFSFLD